jgi:hypothetical protein
MTSVALSSVRKILLLQQTSVALILSTVDSCYPLLLKKLHRGSPIHVSGALSFDALMPVTLEPLPVRIAQLRQLDLGPIAPA